MTVIMAKKTSATITMMITKEAASIVTPRTQKTKSVRQKNLLSLLTIA